MTKQSVPPTALKPILDQHWSTAKSGSLKLAATNIAGPWTHKFNFAAVYSSDADDTTAQRWEAQEQSNYALDTDDPDVANALLNVARHGFKCSMRFASMPLEWAGIWART